MAVTTLTLRDRVTGPSPTSNELFAAGSRAMAGWWSGPAIAPASGSFYQLTRRWTDDESLPWFDHGGWRYLIAVPPTVRLSRGTLKLASRNY